MQWVWNSGDGGASHQHCVTRPNSVGSGQFCDQISLIGGETSLLEKINAYISKNMVQSKIRVAIDLLTKTRLTPRLE